MIITRKNSWRNSKTKNSKFQWSSPNRSNWIWKMRMWTKIKAFNPEMNSRIWKRLKKTNHRKNKLPNSKSHNIKSRKISKITYLRIKMKQIFSKMMQNNKIQNQTLRNLISVKSKPYSIKSTKYLWLRLNFHNKNKSF